MPARSVPCPNCGRRVASGRAECAACGAAMPTTAPPPTAIPDALDTSAAPAPAPAPAFAPAGPATPTALAPGADAVPGDPQPSSTSVDPGLAALVAAPASVNRDATAGLESSPDVDPEPAPGRRPGAYLPPSNWSAARSGGPTLAVAASAARPFGPAPASWSDRRPPDADGTPSAASLSLGGSYVSAPMRPAFDDASAGATDRSVATTSRATAEAAAVPGRASVFADLPFDAPDDLPGWLVTIGSIGAALSFLFPWAPEVLGSPALGTSYFAQWGLASPMHLPPLLFIVAIGALAVLPNGVPTWLRTGILPILAGGLLLGLTWPYLVGGFGGLLGTTVAAAAAILMVMGGAVEVAPRREEGRGR